MFSLQSPPLLTFLVYISRTYGGQNNCVGCEGRNLLKRKKTVLWTVRLFLGISFVFNLYQKRTVFKKTRFRKNVTLKVLKILSDAGKRIVYTTVLRISHLLCSRTHFVACVPSSKFSFWRQTRLMEDLRLWQQTTIK